MKAHRHIVGVAILALSAISCQEDKLTQSSSDWTDKEAVLTVDSETILTYDPLTWQMRSGADGFFCVFNEDESEWFTVTCETMPKAVGDVIKCNVRWIRSTSSKALNLNGINLTVESIDEESGIMALVNYKQHVCAKVHLLR